MSVSYEKWSKLSDEQIETAIAERKVTREYLNWLGITGAGRQLRDMIKANPQSSNTRKPVNHDRKSDTT